MKPIIAIDAMGGDHGPSVIVPAALKVLKKHSELTLILVGQQKILEQQLSKHGGLRTPGLEIHFASEVVDMDEPPGLALRNKKDSSMRVALNLVKEGRAHAVVSAGNTGALMATARFVLKMLPGIDRPAIITTLPTRFKDRHFRMLDLGANVDSTAEHLFQFAVMGSVLTSAVDGLAKPRIGLLNNGEEVIKGNEVVKQTAQKCQNASALNYCGYIEGDDIFKDKVDVVVCDGFTGNLVLKSMEGLAKLIGFYLKRGFMANVLTKLAGIIARPVLQHVYQQIDPGRYNGATLLGLQGTVIKSHGGANVGSFAHAIEEAAIEVQHNVPQKIRQEVERLLSSSGDHAQ